MKPITLLIKPASGHCNLRCSYCFYADECARREDGLRGRMTHETLEAVVKRALESASECSFAFQGGEPTLAGLDFFRDYADLVKRYNTRGVKVSSAIQTNGTLIDEEWARFLKEEGFLVGLSLDGAKETHDLYRRGPDGEGTFAQVMRAAELFDRYKVEYNILTVVTKTLVQKLDKTYRFYRGRHLLYQQYIPCIDPMEAQGQTEYTLTAPEYGKFLCRLFDLWYADVKAERFIYIRYFENLVGMLCGVPPEACGMLGRCQPYYLLESDGSVYPCDFYALDQLRLGNFVTDSIEALDQKRAELRFLEDSPTREADCAACKWGPLCRGGCRRDRDPMGDGVLQKNRYCAGYQRFFAYAYSRLEELARRALERR